MWVIVLLLVVHVVDLISIDLVLLCHVKMQEVTYFKILYRMQITQIGKIHIIPLEKTTNLPNNFEILVC